MTLVEFVELLKEHQHTHKDFELPIYAVEGFKHFLVKSIKIKSGGPPWKDGEGNTLPPKYILISSDEEEAHG